jgi:hypothetical protein
MELNELDYTDVTIKAIPEETRDWLKLWRLNVLAKEGKQGLWLFGPRGGGTSYAAQVIVGRLAFSDDVEAAYTTAVDLVALVRATWGASRQHDADMAVFLEEREIEDRLNYLFYECPLLWIDDFHHDDFDWNFWRRHIQPYVEQRVKQRKPTVISTTMAPDHAFLPPKIIDMRFVTVLCDGTG